MATEDETPKAAATLTADDCERIFHAALESGDARGVEAALLLMASRDPHRAALLFDITRAALAIARDHHNR